MPADARVRPWPRLRRGQGQGGVCAAALALALGLSPAPGPLHAQPADTLQPVRTVSLRGPAEHVAVDAEGNLLLLAPQQHRIYRYLAAMQYDSVVSVGGFGIGGEGFNRPTKLRVPNRQETYVLDYGNRRIVLLNTNLRLVRELDFDALPVESSGPDALPPIVPLSFDVGPVGELFVLNQEDNTVYKYDQFGRFESSFGGLEYGVGRLVTPVAVAVTAANYVFVADTLRRDIAVYDNFGIYQYRLLTSDLPKGWRTVRAAGRALLLVGPEAVWLLPPDRARPWRLPLPPGPVLDAAWSGRWLAVLRQGAVSLYAYPLP